MKDGLLTETLVKHLDDLLEVFPPPLLHQSLRSLLFGYLHHQNKNGFSTTFGDEMACMEALFDWLDDVEGRRSRTDTVTA